MSNFLSRLLPGAMTGAVARAATTAVTSPLRGLAAALLLLTGPAAAQQAHPAPQPVMAEPAPQVLRPALWKLSDDDTVIYLFGTIHALPKDLVWLDGPLANALDSADELVTEIPDPDPAELQALVLSRALLPKGQSLRRVLSSREYAAYTRTMAGLGIPAPTAMRFKPWFAALTIVTATLLRDGYAVESGVEEQLAARMKALGRPHRALETVAFQLAMFDGLPPAAQRRLLTDALAGQHNFRAELDLLVAEWGQGHETRLAELLNQDTDDDARTRAVLLTDRNRNWTHWIERRLAQPGTSFVAVGAGHLAGADSVLALLEQQGRTVMRVQ